MKPVLALPVFAVLLFFASQASAQTPTPTPGLPTWQDEIAKGCLPYHQLTVDDFRVSNDAKCGNGIKVSRGNGFAGLVAQASCLWGHRVSRPVISPSPSASGGMPDFPTGKMPVLPAVRGQAPLIPKSPYLNAIQV